MPNNSQFARKCFKTSIKIHNNHRFLPSKNFDGVGTYTRKQGLIAFDVMIFGSYKLNKYTTVQN